MNNLDLKNNPQQSTQQAEPSIEDRKREMVAQLKLPKDICFKENEEVAKQIDKIAARREPSVIEAKGASQGPQRGVEQLTLDRNMRVSEVVGQTVGRKPTNNEIREFLQANPDVARATRSQGDVTLTAGTTVNIPDSLRSRGQASQLFHQQLLLNQQNRTLRQDSAISTTQSSASQKSTGSAEQSSQKVEQFERTGPSSQRSSDNGKSQGGNQRTTPLPGRTDVTATVQHKGQRTGPSAESDRTLTDVGQHHPRATTAEHQRLFKREQPREDGRAVENKTPSAQPETKAKMESIRSINSSPGVEPLGGPTIGGPAIHPSAAVVPAAANATSTTANSLGQRTSPPPASELHRSQVGSSQTAESRSLNTQRERDRLRISRLERSNRSLKRQLKKDVQSKRAAKNKGRVKISAKRRRK